LQPVDPEAEKASLAKQAEDAERARAFASQSRAENTKRAYRTDWRQFQAWCAERNRQARPATTKTVALFLASVADDYELSSLERKLSAISQAHKAADHESPALTSDEPLHSVWAGVVRSKGRAKEKVAPALTEDIRLMISHLPRSGNDETLTLSASRDRAILLVGFSGALRRSEIVALTTDDIHFSADGLRLVVRSGKSDQEGRGLTKGLRYGSNPTTCPVRALRSWLNRAGIDEGPLFRSIDRHGNIGDGALTGRSVARIVKRSAKRAGMDPSQYSGHSLRAGFTTQAARAGTPERVIMRHTGHKSERMVREYIREGRLFRENPTEDLGL
jgi:integrase